MSMSSDSCHMMNDPRAFDRKFPKVLRHDEGNVNLSYDGKGQTRDKGANDVGPNG